MTISKESEDVALVEREGKGGGECEGRCWADGGDEEDWEGEDAPGQGGEECAGETAT